MSGHGVSEGRPEPLGVTPDERGVNVAVFSAHAEAIELCLFDWSGREEVARILLPERTGDVFHGHVAGVAAGTRYGLRAHGPWAPERGHRFNPAKLLLDPYARAIDRPFRLDRTMFDVPPGIPWGGGPDRSDSAAAMPKAIVTAPEPAATPRRPAIDRRQRVIYELHAKGFTRLNPAIPEAQRGSFAGLAHPASVEHLVKLGVTMVEVMPAMAGLDERHLPPLGLGNYWNYNPVGFLAAEPKLAPGGMAEIRAAVEALQAAGIAVILDVVLNHTAESDHLGPTVSLRGLDNASYYRLSRDDPSRYVDDAGCGNVLALDRPPGLRLALDALRRFALVTGLDGFRFDLATTLARRDDGFDPAAPFLAAAAQDPVLRDLVMIAEPWDIGWGGYRLGGFPAGWGEWNDRYRDTIRRFWRGDTGLVGQVATRLAGSADVLAARHRRLSDSVNFVTAHDGFTLADLVAYAAKHNLANGENNRDGTDANNSWNNGTEGPSEDPAVLARRAADVRALLVTLLASRGTPMLSMGDELGRSQQGNNNAYAQDGPISWLDWGSADHGLAAFTARLIAARKACGALHDDRPLTGAPLDASGLPDVQWLKPDGAPLGHDDWNDAARRTLAAAFYAPAGHASTGDGSRALLALNAAPAPATLAPPEPRDGWRWRLVADSARPELEGPLDAPTLGLEGRSAVLLVEERGEPAGGRRGADPQVLDRLAEAAGIAADWWDLDGTNHRVGDDTKRALLAAMKLPAATTGEARASLARLAAERDFRPLPQALTAREGEPLRLRLNGALATGGRRLALDIRGADGTVRQAVIEPGAGTARTGTALDGRPVAAREVELPPLPIGRYRVTVAEAPDAPCHLAVAPRHCHVPPELAGGARRFGIAAHLYTLRRAGDQGIGDFTALSRLGALAALQGAATIGLNPLHALFPLERARASPYHPSDRRFLDPIYLDVTALPHLGALPEVRAALDAEAGAFAALAPAAAVDYPAVAAAKQRVLQAAFAGLERLAREAPADPAVPAFEGFVAAGGPALQGFATFEAIAEAQGTTRWRGWPAGLAAPGAPDVAGFAAAHAGRRRYAMMQQWLADAALGAAAAASREAGLALGFYRDLAVGTAPDGAEAWSESGSLMTGVSVGAPPDPFAAEGQIWNLPPFDPLALAARGYAPFAELVAANMRHAGALRIDHVLGLRRLFLVPEGAGAAEGAYLAYPFGDLVGQLALESRAARCLVVGEDLGTVPEGVREDLAAAEVLSYKVLWFEREADGGFVPPQRYPPLAAACISTHDLATLAGWWEGADIAERETLGLLDAAAADAARAARRDDRARLLAALAAADPAFVADPDGPLDDALAAAVHALIAATPSLLALVQADDLAGETSALNLPGTDRERPNWRRRLGTDVEALLATPRARAILAAFRGRAAHADMAE